MRPMEKFIEDWRKIGYNYQLLPKLSVSLKVLVGFCISGTMKAMLRYSFHKVTHKWFLQLFWMEILFFLFSLKQMC